MKPTFEWKKYIKYIDGSAEWLPVTQHLQHQIDGIEDDLTHMKENLRTFYDGEFSTLKRDEAELGEQVQTIQSRINELVRKQSTLNDLCKVEHCPWAIDIQSQIDSNGRAIKQIQDVIGGVAGVPSHDILFMTTKEISVTLRNQTLDGGAYWYDFEYDISGWDNAQYQLEGLIYKNLHKDDSGSHGQVEPFTRKALVSLTYDDSKMYGTVFCPKMLDTGSLGYKLIVTCLWKKVM